MSAPVRSMTGFAQLRRTIVDIEVAVSLKSVNHRALDIRFQTGPELDAFEAGMRSLITREVARGHVEVRIALRREAGGGTLAVDAQRLADYVLIFRRAAERHALDPTIDLNTAFRIPGMLVDAGEASFPPDFQASLLDLLGEALAGMNGFRAREGGEIAAHMRGRNQAIEQIAARIDEIRAGALASFHARLRERLAALLEGAAVDPQRLAQEAALLADRSDIAEEVARLRIHSGQLAAVLNSGGEVGKKLDFLLQEMNRETNTILSKTSGIGGAGLGITELALAAKAEIEKLRELVLNLE